MSRNLKNLIGAIVVSVITIYGSDSVAQEPVSPANNLPPVAVASESMTTLRTENRYSRQPLWAANIAAEQRAARERRLYFPQQHALRPNAAQATNWNLPQYGYTPYYWGRHYYIW